MYWSTVFHSGLLQPMCLWTYSKKKQKTGGWGSVGDFCRSRPSKSNKSLRKCVFLFVWVFFARYRKESCEWLIFEHLLSFQSSWLLLKVPQVTPPWHVPMPEWNIVGGSRLHHLANCLLAATSHWRILATSLEEGLTQAKLQFHLVISEERVCVCLCPCVCLLACWDNGWVL